MAVLLSLRYAGGKDVALAVPAQAQARLFRLSGGGMLSILTPAVVVRERKKEKRR